jgi:hypothetical protein
MLRQAFKHCLHNKKPCICSQWREISNYLIDKSNTLGVECYDFRRGHLVFYLILLFVFSFVFSLYIFNIYFLKGLVLYFYNHCLISNNKNKSRSWHISLSSMGLRGWIPCYSIRQNAQHVVPTNKQRVQLVIGQSLLWHIVLRFMHAPKDHSL